MKASSIVRRVMHNVSGKGIVSRVDIDRVDVIPHGSRTALKKVKLSGDASAVTIGDEVSLINVQGEIMAVSSLTFEDIPASESTEVTEYAPKDHTHENIDAGMLDGKHSDRFVQINEEDGITVVPGDMRMNGVLGSTFDRYIADIPNAANLNTYTTTGRWHQSSNAQAATGTNYPTPLAGVLVVYADKSGYIYQTYQTYNGTERYFRSYYSSSWYPWRWLWHDGNAAGAGGTSIPSHSVQAQDGTNEGGQVTLDGAGSNKPVYLDNYASRLRVVTTDTGNGTHTPIVVDNGATPKIHLDGDILLYDRPNGQTPAASTTCFYSKSGLPMSVNPSNVVTPAFVSRVSMPVLQGYFVGAAIVTVATNTKAVALRNDSLDIIYHHIPVPAGWGGKTFSANIFWAPSNATAGNVKITFETRHLTPGSNIPTSSSSNGAQTVATPQVNDRVVKTTISPITAGGEGNAMQLVLYRNANDAADTFAGSVHVLALDIVLV